MKLLIEPEAGADPLIKEIDGAKKSIEIAIFRFDHEGVKGALERAVDRGVAVHALIANTNHGEEKGLRKLELETPRPLRVQNSLLSSSLSDDEEGGIGRHCWTGSPGSAASGC